MVTTNSVGNGLVGSTGTGSFVGSNSPTLTTPTTDSITITNAPVSGTDGTNKTYVDTAISSVNPSTSVYAATTTNIPGAYLNGSSGIGATFTTTATGTFTLDGTTPPLLSRILFKDQSTTFQNGVYVLTTNGTGLTGSIFTRATDYDQPSDINSTGVIAVVNGTVNKLTGWLLNSTVANVGADAITYILYNTAINTITYTNVNSSPYVVLSTDEYLSVDCSGGAITLQFPNAATTTRVYIVKDRTGSAATHNITLQSVSGAVNIDGATTFVMNTNFEAVNLIGNSSSYEIF